MMLKLILLAFALPLHAQSIFTPNPCQSQMDMEEMSYFTDLEQSYKDLSNDVTMLVYFENHLKNTMEAQESFDLAQKGACSKVYSTDFHQVMFRLKFSYERFSESTKTFHSLESSVGPMINAIQDTAEFCGKTGNLKRDEEWRIKYYSAQGEKIKKARTEVEQFLKNIRFYKRRVQECMDYKRKVEKATREREARREEKERSESQGSKKSKKKNSKTK